MSFYSELGMLTKDPGCLYSSAAAAAAEGMMPSGWLVAFQILRGCCNWLRYFAPVSPVSLEISREKGG